MFGFDFQVNAAIVLMLDNIKKLKSITLESNNEDIEILLENDERILAQAKAVVHSSFDFHNVRANLKKALETLSEACNKTGAKKAIFITNSPNPFNDNDSRSAFYGHTRRTFANIPPSAQQIIKNYFKDIEIPLEPDKLTIHVLPFETDDEQERYKEIKRCIDDFIGSIGIRDVPGLGNNLMNVWHQDLFVNGTKENAAISLNKKNIIWPMIVLITDVSSGEGFLENLDPGTQEEVKQQYNCLINSMCERIEFFTRVLYDYNEFKSVKFGMEKCKDFIENFWSNYLSDFNGADLNPEIKKTLIQLILYNVIRRRFNIDKIKEGVKL